MTPSRSMANATVLSAEVVSLATPSNARNKSCGSMKCSGIIGRPGTNPNYVCGRRNDKEGSAHWRQNSDWSRWHYDVEATFCYLDYILWSDGDCETAIAAKCCVAWGKFRNLLLVLTTRHLSLIYAARNKWLVFALPCSMVAKYGDQAPLTYLQRPRREDRICCTKDWDETPSASLWHSFTVGGSDCMDIYSMLCLVLNLSQTFRFLALSAIEA